MFGISFTEILLILSVAVVIVGPKKLPQMLGTLGNWIGKLRRMGSEMRRQTGLDELLRDEGLEGGLQELRGLMRGNLSMNRPGTSRGRGPMADPYDEMVEYDRSREYPVEGPDAYGVIPEDLLDEPANPQPSATGASTPDDATGPAGSAPSPTPTGKADTGPGAQPDEVSETASDRPGPSPN